MKINLNNTYDILYSNSSVSNISLKDLLSWNTILYFYPKDNTPGCSLENKEFSIYKDSFIKKWYNVIWVSKDSIETHKKFVLKQDLNIDLISDPDLILHKELWAYWEKNNYWKILNWVIRSTFIINKNWEVIKEYRNIKAKWHVERLLNDI